MWTWLSCGKAVLTLPNLPTLLICAQGSFGFHMCSWNTIALVFRKLQKKKKSHRYLVLQKSHQSYCIIVVHPLVLVTVGWVVLFEALQWVHLHFTRLSGTGSTGSLLFFSASSPFPCNSRSHFLTFLRSFQIGGTSALLCNIGCADSSCSVNGGARRDWPGQTAVALLSKLFEQTV